MAVNYVAMEFPAGATVYFKDGHIIGVKVPEPTFPDFRTAGWNW